jgi:cytochrome P450
MTRTDELGFEVDLSAEQFGRRIPYEAFAALRRQAPVYWYEPEQYWVVSTYDLVGKVNRDPEAFDDPDRLDVQRAPNKHDSFGAGGPHFCLGAGLARLEARVVFDELRPYLEKMSLAGPPSRVWNTMFNGLKHLPVAL